MANFITNLWESVFTPGTTPTLLIATNVTFGALQLLLAALLFATYSIHFAILSVLCGGLWYSINWFAHELKQAQAKEVAAERLRRKRRIEDERKHESMIGDIADDEGADTEVESGMKESTVSLSSVSSLHDMQGAVPGKSVRATPASTGSEAVTGASAARRRHFDDSEKPGEVSTDSEWEKIDE